MIARHPDVLVEHRRDRVVAVLSETTRGPADFTLDALGKVLALIGRCPALEQQWSGWIRDGLLDAQGLSGPNGSTEASRHVEYVELCVQEGLSPRDWVLIEGTVAHWRELLADPERRRVALYGLAQVLLGHRTLCGRLPESVLSCLDPGTSEAVAIREGFDAVVRGNEG